MQRCCRNSKSITRQRNIYLHYSHSAIQNRIACCCHAIIRMMSSRSSAKPQWVSRLPLSWAFSLIPRKINKSLIFIHYRDGRQIDSVAEGQIRHNLMPNRLILGLAVLENNIRLWKAPWPWKQDQGHWRSFNRLQVTSYSRSIVTLSLACTVSEKLAWYSCKFAIISYPSLVLRSAA